MQDFRQVGVWQKAHKLVLAIYVATESLPKTETFGLQVQLRRSATAIATRIAEGTGRDNDPEFSLDLRRARAGGHELEYLILLAKDLGYLTEEMHERLSIDVIEIRKMISGLLKKMPVVP
jgi:four helix bundle protein